MSARAINHEISSKKILIVLNLATLIDKETKDFKMYVFFYFNVYSLRFGVVNKTEYVH